MRKHAFHLLGFISVRAVVETRSCLSNYPIFKSFSLYDALRLLITATITTIVSVMAIPLTPATAPVITIASVLQEQVDGAVVESVPGELGDEVT